MLRTTALVGLVLALTSCVSPHQDKRLSRIEMPSDFAVEFNVRGDSAAEDPMRQSAQYVVEANRRMRVISGSRAETRTFPRFLRDVTPTEFEALWAHVRDANLMAEPTSPGAEGYGQPPTTAPAPPPAEAPDTAGAPAESGALYTVAITARGRTNRYATTPSESPPTASLLAMLLELRQSGAPLVIPPEAMGQAEGAK